MSMGIIAGAAAGGVIIIVVIIIIICVKRKKVQVAQIQAADFEEVKIEPSQGSKPEENSSNIVLNAQTNHLRVTQVEAFTPGSLSGG